MSDHTHEEKPASWILELRHRLESPPPVRLAASNGRPAAILVPLYVDAGELWTVLTRRAATLPNHKSQIAFPGGGCEPGESIWDAALRESKEEIGLPPVGVLRLGELDEVETPSGYRIVSCVGTIPSAFEATINSAEIAEIFRVPIRALANPNLKEDRMVRIDGVDRTLRIYHVGGRQIWGLTARVIQNLLRCLGLGADDDEANPPV